MSLARVAVAVFIPNGIHGRLFLPTCVRRSGPAAPSPRAVAPTLPAVADCVNFGRLVQEYHGLLVERASLYLPIRHNSTNLHFIGNSLKTAASIAPVSTFIGSAWVG